MIEGTEIAAAVAQKIKDKVVSLYTSEQLSRNNKVGRISIRVSTVLNIRRSNADTVASKSSCGATGDKRIHLGTRVCLDSGFLKVARVYDGRELSADEMMPFVPNQTSQRAEFKVVIRNLEKPTAKSKAEIKIESRSKSGYFVGKKIPESKKQRLEGEKRGVGRAQPGGPERPKKPHISPSNWLATSGN